MSMVVDRLIDLMQMWRDRAVKAEAKKFVLVIYTGEENTASHVIGPFPTTGDASGFAGRGGYSGWEVFPIEAPVVPIEEVLIDSGLTGHPPSGRYAKDKR